MTQYRISEAASLVGVSDDTIRRWVHEGLLHAEKDAAGRQVVPGAELAARAVEIAAGSEDRSGVLRSARNRFVGLVTRVEIDGLMAQVELQCGPHRVVSLMSAEAARELRLEVGSRGVAVVKATMVVVETETDLRG
ncbi:TOBE domain-containing protein [Agromyces cerinus]|uniref:Molybdenum-pterin binding domain-containing protein n=1 Tax=Agromyces cerinus subsp. cerinus TaxID=232089 RepID=A0A1N6DCX1_9MICO|nr:TOBE domain-containing protein [Agromyces cerinus]SIN68652.1 molybdenum-pterin binding domain-containing protein [Agromyces cerinus subsp. cerinus]